MRAGRLDVAVCRRGRRRAHRNNHRHRRSAVTHDAAAHAGAGAGARRGWLRMRLRRVTTYSASSAARRRGPVRHAQRGGADGRPPSGCAMSAALAPVSAPARLAEPRPADAVDPLVPAIAGTMRWRNSRAAPRSPRGERALLCRTLPVVLHVVTVDSVRHPRRAAVRARHRRRHRTYRNAGKALLVLGLVAAASGVWMTLTYPWPEGDERRSPRGTSRGRSAHAVRARAGGASRSPRREFVSHGEWMTRALRMIGLARARR